MKGIYYVYVTPNGMVFVGDKKGNQMPKFQGKLTRKRRNKIKRHMTRKTHLEAYEPYHKRWN